MINEILRYLLRFTLLVLVQGLILKNMELGPFVNPFLYVLFLIQLPFEMPPWLGMFIAFFTGLCIDMFYSTAGMHTTVCTFIGFMRPRLLRLMSPRDGYDSSTQPTMQFMGRTWFLTYAGIIIVVHHLLLFFLEMLSFHEFFWTLLRASLSAMVTLLLVVVTQLLFYRTREVE
jgi:rod shape-determining protein MreD